jgi:hypothetical protein
VGVGGMDKWVMVSKEIRVHTWLYAN